MDFDLSRIEKVRNESKAELLHWKTQSKPGSPQHIAATVELGRRDDQVKSWLWMGCVIVALILGLGATFFFQ